MALPGSAGGVISGLNVLAQVKLGGSKQQDLLRKILGVPVEARLDAALQIGADPARGSKLTVGVSARINETTTIDAKVGGTIKASEIGLFLLGKVRTRLLGRPIELDIDIRPHSQHKAIQTRSRGVVPVAILGSATVNVAEVDTDSLLFAGASPAKYHFEDVNADGQRVHRQRLPLPNSGQLS